MRILVIGWDTTVANLTSISAKRQLAYFRGWNADILVVGKGTEQTVSLSPQVTVHITGGSNPLSVVYRAWNLARRLSRKNGYDVVSVQEPLVCGWIAFLSKSRLSALHVQDHSARVKHVLAKFIARNADRIRTVSVRGKRALVELGVNESRIDTGSVAIDLERYFSTVRHPSDPRIVCIARLYKEKGVDILMRVFSEVIKRVPMAKLVLVGDGPERSNLETLAKELGVFSSVEFVGHQTDIAPYLASASVVVQPSHYEGWGLSITEAAAAGCPIVMTDVGCAGEVIIDKESGLVVPVGDEVRMAEAILSVLTNTSLADRLGKNAREAAKRLPSAEESVERVRMSLEKSVKPIRLLVVAQAVDADDALFGFFTGWLKSAASVFERLTVAGLRVGRYDLPPNVSVFAMRRKESRSKIEPIITLMRESWKRRHDYDAVFVRGDAQYTALLGWWWKLLRKPVVFWYTHVTARSIWFWLAVPWASRVVTAVPESNPLKSAVRIGHHIDTEHFAAADHPEHDPPILLIFGRVSPVKRVDWILEALQPLVEARKLKICIVGSASDEETAKRVRSYVNANVEWNEQAIPGDKAPKIYASADFLVSATDGSMDKVIIEAAASGLAVFAATKGHFSSMQFSTQMELRQSVETYLALDADQRKRIKEQLRAWAESQHGIAGHLKRLRETFLGVY
ncbi:glycosyltransferase family 4 protein [Candidatus Uhrbacteria bacterium]|nr:glycosyltransferase family 4 protein [Candidatus Uhrbacteria bacterium]